MTRIAREDCECDIVHIWLPPILSFPPQIQCLPAIAENVIAQADNRQTHLGACVLSVHDCMTLGCRFLFSRMMPTVSLIVGALSQEEMHCLLNKRKPWL
jgi:hypothetical protein